jgi:ribosome-associated protein
MTDDGGFTTRSGLVVPAEALSVRFSRSSAPGGQHVNTSSTKVDLRCDVRLVVASDVVTNRLLETLGPEVRVVVSSERSQLRNRSEALRRLGERLDEAAIIPIDRRPTRPTRASVRRRLDDKRRHAERKATRRYRDND